MNRFAHDEGQGRVEHSAVSQPVVLPFRTDLGNSFRPLRSEPVPQEGQLETCAVMCSKPISVQVPSVRPHNYMSSVSELFAQARA